MYINFSFVCARYEKKSALSGKLVFFSGADELDLLMPKDLDSVLGV